ncbi:MAG TPA: hypothetical protein VGF28_22320 [Thermoanaerobaculia bacterium]
MKEFYGILGAGAFGGALSWLWSITLGAPLKLEPAVAAIASVILGAGASVIGVYLIANTDRKDIGRALAFAILCGFSWQIVYEAGSSTLERREARENVQQASANVTETAKQLNGAAEEKKTELVQDLVGDATVLLKASGQADSKEAEQKAVTGALSALDAIEESGQGTKPESTTTAVEEIATTALESGHQEVAHKAIETLSTGGVTLADKVALEKIAVIAEEKNDPATARIARRAILRPDFRVAPAPVRPVQQPR